MRDPLTVSIETKKTAVMGRRKFWFGELGDTFFYLFRILKTGFAYFVLFVSQGLTGQPRLFWVLLWSLG